MAQNITIDDLKFKTFEHEEELDTIIKMVEVELSEPYSVFTYRYFLQTWPHLCFMAYHEDKMIGVILGKLDARPNKAQRGYIAMLVVEKAYRKLKIGSKLVKMFIDECQNCGGDEICLETEVINVAALRLYESLGFAKDKKLRNYYMSGNDAYRLKLWLKLDRLVPKFEEKTEEKPQETA
mmetsp:Transcript_14500/g.12307  ORF Transcript_14500/g.12307 Transcript_14500/m.12307 type:complete len:180 (+) Transcript_14500:52-591(+)